jgi:hypothetical protein
MEKSVVPQHSPQLFSSCQKISAFISVKTDINDVIKVGKAKPAVSSILQNA